MKGKGGKGGKRGKVTCGKSKKNPSSRSLKAGLHFPVGRIHRYLKNKKGLCRLKNRCITPNL